MRLIYLLICGSKQSASGKVNSNYPLSNRSSNRDAKLMPRRSAPGQTMTNSLSLSVLQLRTTMMATLVNSFGRSLSR
jgi:hypothetical protein